MGLHQGTANRYHFYKGGLQHDVILQALLLAEGCAGGWAEKAVKLSRQWLQMCGSDCSKHWCSSKLLGSGNVSVKLGLTLHNLPLGAEND